jgi:hypothetical protein
MSMMRVPERKTSKPRDSIRDNGLRLRLTTNACRIFALIAGIMVWPARGARAEQAMPDGAELLRTMRAFDEVMRKNFTCEGTEVGKFSSGVGPITMKWELTCGDPGIAMVFKRTEPAEISYEQAKAEGHGADSDPLSDLSVGVLTEHSLFFGKEYSSQHRVDTVFRVSPDSTARELSKAHVVQLRHPDAPEMTLPILKAFWGLGRMYTQHLDEITAVAKDESGLLHVTAGGHVDKGNLGTWQLIVDPAAAYLVRKASYVPAGSEELLFETENEGVKWSGGVCVAASASWRQTFPEPSSAPHQLVFNNAAPEVRQSLLLEAENSMKEPYPPNTIFMDDRAVPPIVKETPSAPGLGAILPLAEEITSEAVDETLQRSGESDGEAVTPPPSRERREPEVREASPPSEATEPQGGGARRSYVPIGMVLIGLALMGYAFTRLRKKTE